MTESSSMGLMTFNGGERNLRKRDDKSPLDVLLAVESRASVSTNFRTTVWISVLEMSTRQTSQGL